MDRLDERKAAILTAIVRGYVASGEPVGSKRVVEEGALGVSTATVRSEMAALEDAGYIAQPHTSAGRVPTDLGYRYFVDTMTADRPPEPVQADAVEGLLLGAGDLEELLRRATTVLSRLTRYAALVAAPRLDRTRLRHVELVPLTERAVLAVLIADTGRVEKRRLDVTEAVTEADVGRAGHVLNEAATGLRLDQAADVIAGVADAAPSQVRAVLEAAAAMLREGLDVPVISEHVFVGGTANIVDPSYFERLEQVRLVYETLEEQVIVLHLLQDALRHGDPAVRIGHELALAELAACSVVAAGYEAAGEPVGSVGVIGPRRMDYPRTLATVQAVASSVEKALAQLTRERA